MERLGIKISANIHDYGIHCVVRLDGGEPQIPFWDDV